jgi:iron(III) transport system substrate-binding protein
LVCLVALSAAAAVWLAQPVFHSICRLSAGGTVTVYCAQDQDYAEPIFQQFEKETGIHVRPLFDSEAVKTVGMANRLIAERSHPQCDVFWGNEELRTRQLAAKKLFRETNGWAAFGYRSRRILFNTNKLSLASAPKSLEELTNSIWLGHIAMAFPQFGTTGAHLEALRQLWGDPAWQDWCRALIANKPLLVDGNSVVVRTVARGDAWVGLSDSDDVADGQREGYPVAELPLSAEMLLIPNTVAVVRGAPHPEAAQQLFAWLQRPWVAEQLVAARALEAPSMKDAPVAGLQPDWDAVVRDLDKATAEMDQIFLK